MRELPILFKPAMHLAIRERRKTQTRRIIKPQPSAQALHWSRQDDGRYCFWPNEPNLLKPKYQPGDRLYVKEALRESTCTVYHPGGVTVRDNPTIYKLDGHTLLNGAQWKSPLMMPKRCARTWLEVQEVRAERLNDISEEDARAEGCYRCGLKWVAPGVMMTCVDGTKAMDWPCHSTAVEAYKTLWKSINGEGSWGPDWVWAYTFKLLEAK